MVRAKFKCTSVTPPAVEGEGGAVSLEVVVDGSEENKEFFRWTPAGAISLGVVNPSALAAFTSGVEYYVDFTQVGVPGEWRGAGEIGPAAPDAGNVSGTAGE